VEPKPTKLHAKGDRKTMRVGKQQAIVVVKRKLKLLTIDPKKRRDR
jgi:hypothetical protein